MSAVEFGNIKFGPTQSNFDASNLVAEDIEGSDRRLKDFAVRTSNRLKDADLRPKLSAGVIFIDNAVRKTYEMQQNVGLDIELAEIIASSAGFALNTWFASKVHPFEDFFKKAGFRQLLKSEAKLVLTFVPPAVLLAAVAAAKPDEIIWRPAFAAVNGGLVGVAAGVLGRPIADYITRNKE